MTIVSPSTASPLVSPKKRELKTYQSRRSLGDCPAGAASSRSQETAANPERPDGPRHVPDVVVVDIGLPPPRVQETEKAKRGGRDGGDLEISWAAKKRRSAVAGASERGSAIAAAAASAPSAIVQELAGIWVSPKKDQCSLGVGTGAFVVERKDEKLRPCTFAAPVPALHSVRTDSEVSALVFRLPLQSVQKPVGRCHHQTGDEVCRLLKKGCPDIVVVCEGDNGDMEPVSMAGPSTPPLEMQKPLPVREATAAARQCRKTTKHYDCNAAKQPFTSLSSRLQCLGITKVTTVLAKVLTPTDCDFNQSRLQLQPSLVDSPLMIMLTPYENRAVHREGNLNGLELEALDRHGRSYRMIFKFLESIGAYRLIGEWTKFLAQNGVRSGDLFELGAFRFEGRLVLTFMHHAEEDQTHEETEAAESSEEVQIPKGMVENEGAVEGQTSKEIEGAGGAEEKWTREEMEAVVTMLELSDFKDGVRL